MLGPTLESPRLVLRPPTQGDFADFGAFCADEEVMRTLGGVVPPHGAWRQMATIAGAWALQGFGMFSVIEKQSGRWVGRLGPWFPGGEGGGWPDTEVGWGLIRAARATRPRARPPRSDWAFETLGWTRVVHCIAKDSAPSQSVAQRLGSYVMEEDVMLPAPINAPIDVWGRTRAEWRARR